VRDEAKRGKIELTFNEQLPSAFVDVAAAKNHVPMRVEVSCIEQQERLARLARYQQQTAAEGAEGGFSKIEAPPPTHVFSENFRFMHQDLRSAIVFAFSDFVSNPLIFVLITQLGCL
jgi:hypothetical protein